jgi:homospermidine synthase
MDEICQPAEVGWGTHELCLPAGGFEVDGGGSMFLAGTEGGTLMRAWTPSRGPYNGLLLSHVECLTIANHLTVSDRETVLWRPTVQFVYRPCNDALASVMDFVGAGGIPPRRTRLMLEDVVHGADELGVLLMGNPRGSIWFGSRLSATTARHLAPGNNATTLQVCAGILGGLAWILENPYEGLQEPDNIDHTFVMKIARRYLGDLCSVYTGWTPLDGQVAPPTVDIDCPWQFMNFRVC